MQTVKLGLIGAGGIAQAHCRAIADVEGVEVIAASDIVEKNLAAAAVNFPVAHTKGSRSPCMFPTRD